MDTKDEVTIESNYLYDYIGNLPSHTRISKERLLTIFDVVFRMEQDDIEDE